MRSPVATLVEWKRGAASLSLKWYCRDSQVPALQTELKQIGGHCHCEMAAEIEQYKY